MAYRELVFCDVQRCDQRAANVPVRWAAFPVSGIPNMRTRVVFQATLAGLPGRLLRVQGPESKGLSRGLSSYIVRRPIGSGSVGNKQHLRTYRISFGTMLDVHYETRSTRSQHRQDIRLFACGIQWLYLSIFLAPGFKWHHTGSPQ